MRPLVLIPAYKPCDKLLQLLAKLHDKCTLIIVNDGSGVEFESLFTQCETHYKANVLHHAVNMGKGEALKTGFNFCLNHFPNAKGVITADADGQHLPEDIIKLHRALEQAPEKLHIGARAFDNNVPLRSQFGNILTRHIFKWLMGTQLQDTQSGLRGIPLKFMPTLLHTKSRGYDFELDMLVLAHKYKIPIQETPITTVYEDNNKTSHFNPLIDSIKIYYVFVRFLLFAIVSGALDFIAFSIAFFFIGHVLAAESLARVLSGTCNFIFNKELVFKSKNGLLMEAMKYTLLCLMNLVFSYGLISTLMFLGISVYTSKIMALISLFFANFAIQKLLIFTESETDPPLKLPPYP